ncbi:uncharacterized protein F5Z01DRAFT_673193 [Emericellopsis atlantica]|uniref:Inner membrane assembly complex subunit 17 n=1 Tax=Emericellopsis atlantica TaxID=2614577 RepID=A0A9P8CRZ8_9HYPO|nr:uncharacterized protein F5Z01DRAFT_673193 [Emericellopsis atlantica]KAG9255241.1 hypothetical protein F5Z01DRAFT_673193 [Emericellopsis atlantica]
MNASRLIPLRRMPLAPLSISQRRLYASKAPNPASQFYKTFTRPVAKVLLIAVFTYQLIYWSWVKLDTEETKAQADATIAGLEAQVDEYKKKVLAEAKSKSS